jgi:hypothetical protein
VSSIRWDYASGTRQEWGWAKSIAAAKGREEDGMNPDLTTMASFKARPPVLPGLKVAHLLRAPFPQVYPCPIRDM